MSGRAPGDRQSPAVLTHAPSAPVADRDQVLRAIGARLRAEDGAATVLALAIVGALVALSAGFLTVLAGTVASQLAANAADAAALAAADAVSGVVAADPCGIAAEAAGRNGARLLACEITGAAASITVAVAAPFGQATAAARAGPPK